VVFEGAVADAPGGQIAVLRRVRQKAAARLHRQTAGGAALVAVDVEALVRPVARQPFAGPQLDVHPVALRVAVFIQEWLARLAVAGVVLLHGGGPTVRLRRPPTGCVVEGAARQQVRTTLPSRPAVAALHLPQLRIIALVAGVLLIPVTDGGHDFLDGGNG